MLMLNQTPPLDLQQWRISFQKILPTPAEGTAAFEAARKAGQGFIGKTTEVLTEYQNYLLRGAVPLTEAQLSCVVTIAQRFRTSLREALANPSLLAQIEFFINIEEKQ